MSERFDQLAARHEQLRLRTALQRRQLAQASAEIRQRLSRVDRSVNVVRGLARHPLVIAGGVAVLAMLGPRRLLRWASHSATMWTTTRRLLGRSPHPALSRKREREQQI